jgi:hypothetical protein
MTPDSSADFKAATDCLRENLKLLSDAAGNIDVSNVPIWNVSNALLVICDALNGIDQRLRRVESVIESH